jgi:hypothetical protein
MSVPVFTHAFLRPLWLTTQGRARGEKAFPRGVPATIANIRELLDLLGGSEHLDGVRAMFVLLTRHEQRQLDGMIAHAHGEMAVVSRAFDAGAVDLQRAFKTAQDAAFLSRDELENIERIAHRYTAAKIAVLKHKAEQFTIIKDTRNRHVFAYLLDALRSKYQRFQRSNS